MGTLKKIIQISLIILYLIVSVEVPAVAHFYNNQLVSFGFSESDGCCSENDKNQDSSLDPDCCYNINLNAQQEGSSEIATKSLELNNVIASDIEIPTWSFNLAILKLERTVILNNHFLKWLVPKKLFILFYRLILHH